MRHRQSELSLNDLSHVVGLPARRIRLWIARGLVDPPIGRTRSARYTHRHVQQLQAVKDWREAGYSLERIHQLRQNARSTHDPIAPGTTEAWQRQVIDDGIELHIRGTPDEQTPEHEPLLDSSQIPQLREHVKRTYERLQTSETSHEDGPRRQTPRPEPAPTPHPQAEPTPGRAQAPDGGVVVFSGPMIDAPDQPEPRFPAWLEPRVKQAIQAAVKAFRPRIGVGTAACGSDILFLETVLEQGGSIHVVLPFDIGDFLRSSVLIDPNGRWAERYYQLLDQADSVVLARYRPQGDNDRDWERSNKKADVIAQDLARARGMVLHALAVWDAHADSPRGGVGKRLQQWEAGGFQPELIDLAALRQQACAAS
jgi:DNA-binding transcriptional MerR regulator